MYVKLHSLYPKLNPPIRPDTVITVDCNHNAWRLQMVKIKVKLYARLVELAGISDLELEMFGKPRLKDLLEMLSKQFGKDFQSVVATPSDAYDHYLGVILVNERESKRLNGLETELKENDIIRIIPPIFGG